jgi:hypothetical protein
MRHSDDTELRDIRLQIMHTGILSDYQLREGEWEERYRVETTRAVSDGAAVRQRGEQQGVFNKKGRGRGRRREASRRGDVRHGCSEQNKQVEPRRGEERIERRDRR